MRVLTIENKKDEKFLRKKTAAFDFSKFTKKQINELIKEMRKIMKKEAGAGLSANQVGYNFKLFIAESFLSDGKLKFYAIFNPKIGKVGKKKEVDMEGCLSVPSVFGEVERASEVIVSGFDKNQREIKIKASGLLARVFQHEIDHLNGILFIDKAKNIQKIKDEEKSKI